MKLRQLITTLALAVGITTAAQAATPVAVWDGDFTTAGKGGYTLELKSGGALPTAAGALALAGDVLKINKDSETSAYANGAIVVKYSNYAANASLANTAIASANVPNGSEDAGCEANGGILKAYWGTTVNRTLNASIGSYVKDDVAVPASGYLILAYNTTTGTAAFLADVDKATWKGGYDNGIKWKGKTVQGFAIGGPRQASPAATMGPCATMTVEAVALFENFNGLTQAGIEELMAYKFPTEALTKMYNNRLSTGAEKIPAATYGAITVPGYGYKATKFDAATKLSNTASGDEITGSYANIIKKPSGDTDIYAHTLMGWFKIDALPTTEGAAGATTIYSAKAYDGAYGGYKVAVGSDGTIYVGQCDNEAWRGSQVTTTAKVAADTWFHLAISVPGRGSARTTTATVFINGQDAGASTTTFGTNLNGNNCSYIRISAGITAAGIYVDTAALTDPFAVAYAATNPAYVVPFVPTYTATISADTNWSDIEWTPAKPAGGLEADAVLTLNVENNATLTFFWCVEMPNASLTINGAVKIAAGYLTYSSIGDFIHERIAAFGSITADGATSAEVLSGYSGTIYKTANQFRLHAQKYDVISINFAGGTSVSGTDYTGLAAVQGNTWMNMTTTWGSGGKTVDLGTLKATSDGSTTKDVAGTGSCYAANTYSWNSATDAFLKGYLDDGGNHAQVTIENVPFGKYDVIVYCATDQGSRAFDAVTVNGKKYTYDNDEPEVAKLGADKWGASQNKTAAYGVNAIRICGQWQSTLTIVGGANADGARGGIAAVQIVETERISPVTATAEIDGDTGFSGLMWEYEPEDPGRGEFYEGDTIILRATGDATLEFDVDLKVGTLKVESEEGVLLSFKRPSDYSISVQTLDLSEAADGIGWDATEGDYTACSALKDCLLNNNVTVNFKGESDSGATIDYGTSYNNNTVQGHFFFEGGTHTFQKTSESAGLEFGANASVENPTLWAKDDTTLYFKSRNPCGWSAAASDAGIVRIGNGAKVVPMNADANAGTWYWSQQFYLDDGATLQIDTTGDNFRTIGNDSTKPHFKVADGGTAEITGSDSNYLTLPSNGSAAMNFDVGDGATLTVSANMKSLANGKPVAKYGTGTLKFTGDLSAFAPAFTVAEGTVEIATAAFFKQAATLTVNEGATLVLDIGEGNTLVLRNTVTNDGTIDVASGTLVVMDGVDLGTVTTSGGAVKTGYNVGVNDLGKFKIPDGKTSDDIVVLDNAGNVLPITKVENGYVYFEWEITGGACWWDYEFEGNGNNDGTEGTALSWDNDRPFKGAEYVTDEMTGGQSLHIPTRPWRNVSSWPTTATFMMYGTMLKDANRYYVVFGSTTGGSKNTVFLATDDIDNSKVVLCRANGSGDSATVTKLCTMTVPNATATKHLYAFVLKTAEEKTTIDIYLDGELLQSYPFGEVVSLGSGFQIASPHGGLVSGYARPVNEDPATLDWLRVYDVELTKATLEKYAVEYPYVSPNGSYQRTVKDGDLWTATDAWTKEGTEPAEAADVPAASSTVKLTVEGATTLGINLDEDIRYEAIKISGDDLMVALATGEQSGKVISAGRVTAGANVTFKYDAFTMFNAPLTVKAGKTVTFDLSMVDMTKFFTTQTYDLTGYTTLETGATVTFTPPAQLYGREITAAIDETTKHYILTVTVPEKDFNYTDGNWTWGDDQPVDGVTVSNNTALAINVKSGTLEWGIDRATINVDGGTLKATATGAGTITVNDGGTFDLNGQRTGDTAKTFVVVLNGGTLANSAEGQGIVKSLTLTKGSTVDTSYGVIAIQSAQGGWAATTLALNGNTLAKTGTNRVEFVSTTVADEGEIDVNEGTLWTQENCDYGDALIYLKEDGVFEVREGKTATVTTFNGDEGGKIIVHGTISDFTFTEGDVAVSGAGTFGTITLDDEPTIDIGTKRGLTINEEGTVNATITDAERATGTVTVFTSTSEDKPSTIELYDEQGKKITGFPGAYDQDGNYVVQFYVNFTIADVENATKEVTGATQVEGTTYKALPDAAVTVTYTANSGYFFAGGEKTSVVEATAAKDITITTETERELGAAYIVVQGTTTTNDYYTFDAAITAAVADDTVTLLKDIETATAQQWTIAKNITIDFADKTIEKTVANDWVFTVANGADVIFTGTTGGIVHYPAVLNQGNPASMIQILGKLTVNGGVYESDYTVFKVDEDGGCSAAGELVVNGGSFTIAPRPDTTYTGLTFAVMNWSKATLNGGAFTGDVTTLSSDGNATVKAGETIVDAAKITGKPVYKLQVTGSTYTNVPKIKGVAIANVTLVKSASITDELELVEDGEYVTVQKKVSGPYTPGVGGGTVEPVPGEENVYVVQADPSSKTVTIEGGLKDTDTIRVTTAEDITVVGVPANQIEVKIGGTVIPNGAFVGGDATGFSTALNKDGEVTIGEETIKVQPTVVAASEGTIAEGAVATKAIPGLTYTLKRGTVLGTYDVEADTAVAETTTVSLKDTTETKPADKAFYQIQVSK